MRGNEGWKDWGFKDLLRELQKWTQINPVEEIAVEKLEKDQTGKRNQQFKPPLPIFNTHQSKPRSGNQCVYCEDDNQRAINCTKVTSVHERQKILSEKKLCFNCTGTRHRADECKSKLRCQICDRKHHTSICHKQESCTYLCVDAEIRTQLSPPRNRGTPRIKGPLTTEETNRQRLIWEKQAQRSCDIERDRVALNLQPNQEGLLECRCRVQGEYPVYIPETSILGLRLVEEAHKETLHGGVGLTMARVCARYWIPKLRQLTKKVRKSCHGRKKFQASAYAAPPPGNLPTTRTQGTNPYQVIGVDYAGPIRYRVSKQREGKAYVLLYACSLTRGIYLDLLPNLETEECLKSLKQFIARRGRPERIYSDNGRTFVGAANWIRAVMKDERLQTYLSINQIKWQFNLSRAPWWGGQFERLIGLVKSALNKTIGNGLLWWK